MTLTNCYITVDEFKEYLFPAGNAGSGSDVEIEAAVTAACRNIDTYCARRFYLDDTVSARYFQAFDPYRVTVDDFSTSTGLIVATDDSDNGNWTDWTIVTDYDACPFNREANGISGLPYNEIVSTRTRTFPVGGQRSHRVKVTAKWGWAAVPDMVKQAACIHSARIFRRAQTPDGIAGGEAFGTIRVANKIDPDVALLLGPFRAAGGVGLVVA